MTLGNRIQAARKRLDVSQKELGAEFGISPAAVSSWERDLTVPEFDNLCRLPGILKVPADWLLTGGNSALPDAEFIQAWNRLPDAQRRHALRYLQMLGEDAPQAVKPHRRAS